MIPWHVAEELGYQPSLIKNTMGVHTANGQIHVPLLSVESLMVLGKELKQCDVLIHDLPETSRVDGLIGLSFLKNCKLTIDFQKGVLKLD